MPKLVHYRSDCIGCNSCVEHAPDNWEIDEIDGKARLKRSQEKKKDIFITEICDFEIEKNQCAGMDCPVRIIHVLTDNGRDITYD